MPEVADTFQSVMDKMTYGTDFKLVNLWNEEISNITQKDSNTSIDEPEKGWNIHLVSYHMLTCRVKPSSNCLLSYCSWSFGFLVVSHKYKMKNWVGWEIMMNTRIGFKFQATARPWFHPLVDWCYQVTLLFQVCLKIQWMILWWTSMVQRHCILLWRVWRMPSRQKTKMCNRMGRTIWYKFHRPWQSGDGQNWKLPTWNHWFGSQCRMHSMLIWSGQRKTKNKWRCLWRNSLHKILLEHDRFTEGA